MLEDKLSERKVNNIELRRILHRKAIFSWFSVGKNKDYAGMDIMSHQQMLQDKLTKRSFKPLVV